MQSVSEPGSPVQPPPPLSPSSTRNSNTSGPLVTHPSPDDPIVARAVLNGNFESAVEACLSQGRVADALVLAAASGRELWSSTRDKYLASNKSPFMARLSAIVHQDFGNYVAQSSLVSWKETLGLVNTYASAEELPALCDQLAARLETEVGDRSAATLCYMCAANTAKTVELWRMRYEEAIATLSGGDEVTPLLELMEKCVVFQETTQTKEGYMLVADKLTAFAELLSAQGCLHEAMGYLVQLPPAQEREDPAAMLMYRIHGANPNLLASPPPVPFDEVYVSETGVTATADSGYGQQQAAQADYGASYNNSQYMTANAAYTNGATTFTQADYGYADANVSATSYSTPAPMANAYGGYSAAAPAATAYGGYSCASSDYGYNAPPAPAPAPYTYTAPPTANYEPAPATLTPPAPTAYGSQPSTGGYGFTTPAAPPPAATYTYQAPPPPAAAPAAPPPPIASFPPAAMPPAATPFQYQAPAQPSYDASAGVYGQMAQQPPPQPAPPPPAPPKPTYDASGVISTIQGLMGRCGAYQLQPVDKRRLEDTEKRSTTLFQKLQDGSISNSVFEKLQQLCSSLAGGDVQTALAIHMQLTTTDWTDNGHWLMGLKRLIELVGKLGVTL
mmetsp:Transcript_15311/g.41928  ORF Transcript_15311/g.41928 Transcript_15311/m.41928 type:complete len:619 (-) Transcript_15311:306-2162(-)